MGQGASPEAVLVVEDEPLVRMVAVDALSDLGLCTYEAAAAQEALKILAERRDVKLVFTDINMPGSMDGLKLAERIHKLWPWIELIVTSGRERLMDRDLPDHGTFLAKPYRTSQLVGLIRQKLGWQPEAV